MRRAFARVWTCLRLSRPRRVADFEDPIGNETRVYGTHHIGASTDQAQEAIAAETVRIIRKLSKKPDRCRMW